MDMCVYTRVSVHTCAYMDLYTRVYMWVGEHSCVYRLVCVHTC